ncbi:MAG: TetR family transcriptional regulator C-terminal domain-containing protein, partial [Candidatus Rokuibacteriota bacterium]
VQEGHFRPDFDAEQFAYEFHGAMLSYHHVARLLHDPKAEARVRQALESLLARARPPARTAR